MASELAFRMREDGYLMQINQLRDERDKLKSENDKLKSESAELLKLIDDAWFFACELYFREPPSGSVAQRFAGIDARVLEIEKQHRGEAG